MKKPCTSCLQAARLDHADFELALERSRTNPLVAPVSVVDVVLPYAVEAVLLRPVDSTVLLLLG